MLTTSSHGVMPVVPGVYLSERCNIVELRDDATLEVPAGDAAVPYETRRDKGSKYNSVSAP